MARGFLFYVSQLLNTLPRWAWGRVGLSSADVCSELTGVSASFWTLNEHNMRICGARVISEYASYALVALVLFVALCGPALVLYCAWFIFLPWR